MGVADQCGQMGLVRHLAAERDGEPQGGTRRVAEPRGQQRSGCRGLAEGRQGYVCAVLAVEGRVERAVGGNRVLEDAELVDGVGPGALLVALAQQGAGLDEAQGQALRLEPEVAGPVGLLLGEDTADGSLDELHAARAVETAEEDLFEGGVGGGRGHLRRRADHEGALGRRVEQLVQSGAAELDVVQDDDRADVTDQREQFVLFRTVQGCVVDGVEEVVEQVARRAVEAAQADDAVGGEVPAVLGDEVEEAGAAGTGGAREAHGAAAGEEPHQALALLLARQERQRRLGRARRNGRPGRAVHLGPLGRRVLRGPPRALARRAGLYLAAVDGVDGEQVVARDELHRACECGRVLSEVRREGSLGGRWRDELPPPLSNAPEREVPPSSWPYSSGPRLFGSIGFKPPKSVVCALSPSRPCCTPRCRFWSGPAAGFVRQRATEP